jgi:5,10-methylenetetrahydrofolate reductase
MLDAEDFVVTAELGAPLNPDPETVRSTARALAPVVVAANVTDNQAATVKVSPVACSVWMMEEGLAPILQLTTRDRNVMALQSDLLGAWGLGVRNMMALSGDPLSVGPYEGRSTAVSEVDSVGLVKLAADMNQGHLLAGEQLAEPTDFCIMGAANPLIDSVKKLEQKVDAGVRCFQTNIVYDLKRFSEWFGAVARAGLVHRAQFLVGIMPPRSTRALQHLHDNIPGVDVDDATFAAMEGRSGDDAKARGIEIAAKLIGELAQMAHVAGVHVMAPGWEAEAVPLVLHAAGFSGGAPPS